jgi:hypothetical protein
MTVAVAEGNQKEEVEVHLPMVEEAVHHPVVVVVDLRHTGADMSRVLEVLPLGVRHSLNHSQILGNLHIRMPVVLLEEQQGEEAAAAREQDRHRRRRQVLRHSHHHSYHGPCPRLPMDVPTSHLDLESRSHREDGRFSHAATEQLHL